MGILGGRKVVTATIAAGGSLSAAVPLGNSAVVGIMPPATGTGDFDALTVYLLFQVSLDGTTYSLLRDATGAVVTCTVAANNVNGAMYLDHTLFMAWPFIKVATYQTDKTTVQTQTAETDIVLVLGPVAG